MTSNDPAESLFQDVLRVINSHRIDIETSGAPLSKILSATMVLINAHSYFQTIPGSQKKELALRIGRAVFRDILPPEKVEEALILYDRHADEVIEVLYWTAKNLPVIKKKTKSFCQSLGVCLGFRKHETR